MNPRRHPRPPARCLARNGASWSVGDEAEAALWLDAGADVLQLEKLPVAAVARIAAIAARMPRPPLIAAAGGECRQRRRLRRAGAGAVTSSPTSPCPGRGRDPAARPLNPPTALPSTMKIAIATRDFRHRRRPRRPGPPLAALRPRPLRPGQLLPAPARSTSRPSRCCTCSRTTPPPLDGVGSGGGHQRRRRLRAPHAHPRHRRDAHRRDRPCRSHHPHRLRPAPPDQRFDITTTCAGGTCSAPSAPAGPADPSHRPRQGQGGEAAEASHQRR